MADNTKIEWTEATWNPITGCSVTSPGCTNCYAMQLAGTRLAHHESRAGLTREVNGNHVWTGEVRFNEQWLDQPLRWKRPRMIFVCAHGDLFHESVPDWWVDYIFAVMALSPQHTFQVLTKRAKRMREYLSGLTCHGDRRFLVAHAAGRMMEDGDGAHATVAANCDWPLPNVWLGVSVEDQQRADERIPDLLATPAAIRWISAEPLLGPVDLTRINQAGVDECFTSEFPLWRTLKGKAWTATRARLNSLNGHYWGEDLINEKWEGWTGNEPEPAPGYYKPLDWVVVGGESGKDARPMHPDWARALRDQCAAAAVPFFFKQWGLHLPTGQISGLGKQWLTEEGEARWMKGTKAITGRLLDGVEHNAMPGGNDGAR